MQTVRHRDYFLPVEAGGGESHAEPPDNREALRSLGLLLLAAVRNARRGRVQTSFNLAFGSAMASIGLTIPAIAIASIWLDGPPFAGSERCRLRCVTECFWSVGDGE